MLRIGWLPDTKRHFSIDPRVCKTKSKHGKASAAVNVHGYFLNDSLDGKAESCLKFKLQR
jgi:hypothetical protein